jgi:hypothetical protein
LEAIKSRNCNLYKNIFINVSIIKYYRKNNLVRTEGSKVKSFGLGSHDKGRTRTGGTGIGGKPKT